MSYEPLAERLRPRSLDDYIGQRHLVGEGAVIRRMIESGNISSFILWGPPGVGKTTLARIIAEQTQVPFYTLSAVTSGVKDDWWKYLTEYYAKAAEDAAKFGCKIGLHNHAWEFQMKLSDGTTVWDYFFKNTPANVCMQQDVGWTTSAGYDPCEQYVKYPHRSPSLHAKENGCLYAPDYKREWAENFDAILGKPGTFKDGRKVQGVDWDRLFKASDADGVKWYVVECEKHEDSLMAIDASFKFLKSKGRC